MVTDFLAGLICGLATGTVFLGGGVYVVLRNRDIYERLQRVLPQGITPMMVMLGYVIAVPLVWGTLGGIAGILYSVINDAYPSGGLGSSNVAYTAAILCIAALAMLTVIVMRRSVAGLGLVLIVAFVIIFGWLLPLLADWR